MTLASPVPPCRIVLDHMAPLGPSMSGPSARSAVLRLLKNGRTWIKVSAPYLLSSEGPPAYADAGATADHLLRAAPERMVWASDWPHATETNKPDDASLLDLFGTRARDEETRMRKLVHNPAELYGFPA